MSFKPGWASAPMPPVPSTASDSAMSGSGAARLDQTVKASMSTLPTPFASTLPAPQNAAAE